MVGSLYPAALGAMGQAAVVLMAHKRKLPPYPQALPCVVVAVDPGATAGWAIYLEGRTLSCGAADSKDAKQRSGKLSVSVFLHSRLVSVSSAILTACWSRLAPASAG